MIMILEPLASMLLDLEDAQKALSAANAETDRYRSTMVKMVEMIQACCRGDADV